jgi:hypothetical protein
MFCPKCGSNQGDGKKFCTVCGTNLLVVSQALTGQLAPPQPIQPMVHQMPPMVYQAEFDRQRETRKGITMAVLGGSYLVYKLISFIFSFPFTNSRSPFGFGSFIAFIICAVGISKIIGSRVTNEAAPTQTGFVNPPAANSAPAQPATPIRQSLPQPVFSAATPMRQSAPNTNELEPVKPTISVTEDETKHLVR